MILIVIQCLSITWEIVSGTTFASRRSWVRSTVVPVMSCDGPAGPAGRPAGLFGRAGLSDAVSDSVLAMRAGLGRPGEAVVRPWRGRHPLLHCSVKRL
jgi:hypothetical protein